MEGSLVRWFIVSFVVGIGWVFGTAVGSTIVEMVKGLIKK